MRILIILVALVALGVFVTMVFPVRPWLEKRRSEAEAEPYQPARTIDPSDPPPAVPEPEDHLGPGDRDVPPGSRRDRQRHGKP